MNCLEGKSKGRLAFRQLTYPEAFCPMGQVEVAEILVTGHHHPFA
jgi:hypothetical protein